MEKNQLTTIADGSFSSLEHLRIVRLSNNHLTLTSRYRDEYGAKSLFYESAFLEELHLTNNSVSEIFNDWTISMTKLRKLDLKYNNISFITVSTFLR